MTGESTIRKWQRGKLCKGSFTEHMSFDLCKFGATYPLSDSHILSLENLLESLHVIFYFDFYFDLRFCGRGILSPDLKWH